ncbi:rhamnulokinase [Microbacterium sp. VKM Ac-2870]|uniref:rhamnulokinase n=1 Tax=Microbacterium sp. VKM Ac-2870 TaxID=2783825 RepID=UPI00188AD868|nr:rhamnulokinase family protein [Microbacterium sp. VKM Ac-2870]MBF4562200.1 rhamnulokinase [Microbacterium sp. VKM Ac-2870]
MTQTRAVAAIDLGATSGRVVVGRVGDGVLETETVARFANDPVRLGDGLHWDVTGLYAAVLRGLREAFRAEPRLASIGVDSWAVDYGLLREGQLLGVPFHYRDERTARGVVAVERTIGRADLFARNGLQFLPFTTAHQLAAEPPGVLALADTLLLMPDLLAFWLTGIRRAELTNASTTGLLDARTRTWDDGLVSAIGVPRTLLPALISPGERIGDLLPHVRAAVGGSAPVVAVGSHDTASAVVAVPMHADAAAYISCGTWGLVGVEVAQPVLSPEVSAANVTNEGGVDGRVRLLHNVMGLWILTETIRGWSRRGEDADLGALLAAAAEVPASAVPVFDVDDARFLTPGDMPARIDAWCDEHGLASPKTRPAYVRAIIESLAQAFADAVSTTSRLGRVDVRTVHLVGGGALNELLCQRTADRTGMPVVAGPVEATALGNVLVQARAAGMISGALEELRDLVARTHTLRRYEPR